VRQTERDTARDAAEAAREAANAAREQARQAKEGAWTRSRGQKPSQARERARQARDDARGHAQRLREEAAQLRVDAREQWNGWSNWSEWSHWADRPGRAHDLGALRDFERLARDFVTDLRSVAWDSSTVLGSEVIPALRDILADTLDRIRTEVIGPMNTSGRPSDAPPADDSESKDS
jgi:hypothetical protein